MDEAEEKRVGAWEELRRRRVIRVAVAYVAATFAVMELTKWLLGVGGATDGNHRVLLGAAVLGFPLAVVLAFVYDVTPSGIVRTPEDATANPSYDTGPRLRWGVFVVATAAVGLVVRFLRM